LACAITFSDGNILRLSAIPADSTPTTLTTTTTQTTTTTTVPSSPDLFWGGRRGGHRCGRGGRGRWGEGPEGRGGHRCGRGGRGRWGEFGPEAWKSRLVFKRDMFKSVLAELQQYPELTPEQQQTKEFTQAKLTKIEGRLEKIENGGFEDDEKERKEWKHDKMHKCEKKKVEAR